MALFLDSADGEEARTAAGWGFVVGCTTNPALLARAGHTDPLKAMELLCGLLPGPVFYQVMGRTLDEMRHEAERFLPLGESLGLKIPCTLEGLRLTRELDGRAPIAATGVFTPGQAYLAAQAGADYVIPYVNRVTRFTGDGPGLIAQMAAILEPEPTAILAAGIKSPAEAVETLLAGADHVSLPFDVITGMATNPLTERAMEDFAAAWSGNKA
jgi:transaldolase